MQVYIATQQNPETYMHANRMLFTGGRLIIERDRYHADEIYIRLLDPKNDWKSKTSMWIPATKLYVDTIPTERQVK